MSDLFNGMTRIQLRQAWINDLRKTTVEQGFGRLCDGKTYCCLGRLCEVANLVAKKFSDGAVYHKIGKTSQKENDVHRLYRFVGLTSETGFNSIPVLVHMNDDRKLVFSQIADELETEKYWRPWL